MPVSLLFSPVANPIGPIRETMMKIDPDLPVRGSSSSRVVSAGMHHYLHISPPSGSPQPRTEPPAPYLASKRHAVTFAALAGQDAPLPSRLRGHSGSRLHRCAYGSATGTDRVTHGPGACRYRRSGHLASVRRAPGRAAAAAGTECAQSSGRRLLRQHGG